MKLNIYWSYDSVILAVDIHPREMISCQGMFTLALFLVAQNWVQLSLSSTGEKNEHFMAHSCDKTLLNNNKE